jgi:CRISPR type IV-associated protein Csf2
VNIRLSGLFQTRSPLSHIGETLSTITYLSQEPILQPDGSIEEVFAYNGNAWRGQLRDLSAAYLLEHLGGARVPLKVFHLLFAGGAIGGEQKTDIAAARQLRQALPHLSIFGGGVGNQILGGKLRISNAYPVCREAIPVLPEAFHDPARLVGYAGLTFEKSFSRFDDSKNVHLLPHLQTADIQLLEAPEKKAKKDGDVSTQMRMTAELLAPGVSLYTEIDAMDVSEVELGCLTAALHTFSRSPVIGGQGNRGHGRVSLDYRYLNLDSGDSGAFLTITAGGMPLLAEPAERAKHAYDQHVRAQYDALLSSQSSELRNLLEAA